LRQTVVEVYNVSKTFDAPLEFVFDWCTDFREDDGKMVGSEAKHHFLERTDERVVWVTNYEEGGKMMEGFRVVWLEPPDSWHLDASADVRELGDYKLTSLGKDRTRLDMVFQLSYDDPKDVRDKKEWEKEVLEEWDTYGKHLEQDYKKSLDR
jgi:hypothetical protein